MKKILKLKWFVLLIKKIKVKLKMVYFFDKKIKLKMVYYTLQFFFNVSYLI